MFKVQVTLNMNQDFWTFAGYQGPTENKKYTLTELANMVDSMENKNSCKDGHKWCGGNCDFNCRNMMIGMAWSNDKMYEKWKTMIIRRRIIE